MSIPPTREDLWAATEAIVAATLLTKPWYRCIRFKGYKPKSAKEAAQLLVAEYMPET